ncbi:EfeM/EfeO family lipoprotein [Kutzneria albida]|uniref:Imelysin-like domain-containing protein n=1 Tax=Kutzneria albida DSM 43870 TaxID=1449976 RepID=W5W3L0_9PSEU|nr:EfeM/EfeO family lipoprotein [Kutzneria albida]AHH95798.1 hypothetical protein KALB_2430 [Kutzneria albida DSM 43870]
MSQRRPVLVVTAVVAVVAAAFALALRPWESGSTETARDSEITVSTGGCGSGWTDPHPGRQTFQLHNTGSQSAEVQLVELPSGRVHGEVDGLGPGTTAQLDVQLGPGDYAFRCLPDEVHPVTGSTVHVGGTGESGPAVVPVSQNDLLGAVRQYQSDVATGLDGLVAKTATLRAAVDGGNLDAAKAAWLPAHLAYNRLGAAYGTFGEFAAKIDGGLEGLAGGVHDESFSGFHRLEQGLWHGESADGLRAVAAKLEQDVRGLREDFPNQQVEPNDLGLRAHEIMENALQFELTGENDMGSGTTLATALANLDGTAEVLKVLDPVLRPRYAGLAGVTDWMGRVRELLTAAGTTPVGALDRAARQKINGAVGELLERLAPVAAICEVRR